MIDLLQLRRPLAWAIRRSPEWSWLLAGVVLFAYAVLAAVRFYAIAQHGAATDTLTLASLCALGAWSVSSMVAYEAAGTLLAAWVKGRARVRRHAKETRPCAG